MRRIARTTQGVLQRLVNFFLILAGGWLTNTVIDMISANADGNIELLNKLKGKHKKCLEDLKAGKLSDLALDTLNAVAKETAAEFE